MIKINNNLFYCIRQSGERILFESFQISPAGIDRDAMRGCVGPMAGWQR